MTLWYSMGRGFGWLRPRANCCEIMCFSRVPARTSPPDIGKLPRPPWPAGKLPWPASAGHRRLPAGHGWPGPAVGYQWPLAGWQTPRRASAGRRTLLAGRGRQSQATPGYEGPRLADGRPWLALAWLRAFWSLWVKFVLLPCSVDLRLPSS